MLKRRLIFHWSVTNFASAGAPTLDPSPTNNVSQPVVTLITNIPPVANPDSYALAENTTNWFAVLLNDEALNPGGFLTLVSVNTTNGVATTGGASVVFTPALNFVGTLTLNWLVSRMARFEACPLLTQMPSIAGS